MIYCEKHIPQVYKIRQFESIVCVPGCCKFLVALYAFPKQKIAITSFGSSDIERDQIIVDILGVKSNEFVPFFFSEKSLGFTQNASDVPFQLFFGAPQTNKLVDDFLTLCLLKLPQVVREDMVPALQRIADGFALQSFAKNRS
ncbi:hypothetical protein ES708_12582 [subsurface metagenome]